MKTSILLKDVLTFYLWHLHVYLFVKICRLFVELIKPSFNRLKQYRLTLVFLFLIFIL